VKLSTYEIIQKVIGFFASRKNLIYVSLKNIKRIDGIGLKQLVAVKKATIFQSSSTPFFIEPFFKV